MLLLAVALMCLGRMSAIKPAISGAKAVMATSSRQSSWGSEDDKDASLIKRQ